MKGENVLQPAYECLKGMYGIDPAGIRRCRSAGTDVCDRDCGVYRSQGIEEHNPNAEQNKRLNQPGQ